MKKIKMLSAILAVLMIFSVFSFSTFAASWSDDVSLGSIRCSAELDVYANSGANLYAEAINGYTTTELIRVNVQCAVYYDDTTWFVDDTSNGDVRVEKGGSASASLAVDFNTNKIVDTVYNEFYFIHDGDYETIVFDVVKGVDF